MTVKLTFEFDNPEIAAGFLAKIVDGNAVTLGQGTGKVTKKRSSKKTEAKAEEPETEAPTEETAEDDSKFTFDDIRTELTAVSGAKGIGEAKKVLAKFDAKSLSDVKPEDYEKFVKACVKAAAGTHD